MVYFFILSMRGCIGASSDSISLSLVTCKGNAGKEVLYGSRKHFDCSSEVSFAECAFCIKGSSLWSKVIFVVICTGGKSLSDFCKSGSTTVEGSDFCVKENMVYVCVVECFVGFGMFW